MRREREVRASGQTPLDYLLEVMRDIDNEQEIRVDAAAKAAPYVHPKLSAVRVQLKSDHDFSGMSDAQVKMLEELLLYVVDRAANQPQVGQMIEHEE